MYDKEKQIFTFFDTIWKVEKSNYSNQINVVKLNMENIFLWNVVE